jgi:hypothetical protein
MVLTLKNLIMTEMYLNKEILQRIVEIVEESKVDVFTLVEGVQTGIGATLDLQYKMKLHGESVTVTVPLIGPEDW